MNVFTKIYDFWQSRKEDKTVHIVHDEWTEETDEGFTIRCEKCGREEFIVNKRLKKRDLQLIWLCNDCGNQRVMFTLTGANEEHGIGIWEMLTPSGKVVQGMIELEEFEDDEQGL